MVNAHDDSLAASTSSVIDFTATQGTTFVQVFATNAGSGLIQSASLGQPVTFYAIVQGTYPDTTMPKGSVTFFIDGVAQPPSPFGGYNNTSYSRSITISTLSPGSHVIKATYSGEAQLSPSPPSPPFDLLVDGSSTVQLVTNAAPTLIGHPAIFAAAITGVGAKGEVAFGTGGVILGYAPVISGVAVFQTTRLTPGIHTIEAVYLGDDGVTAILGNFAQATVTFDGPRVTGVKVKSPEVIVLTFDQPLKRANALDVKNYRIQGLHAASPRVVSAKLDASGMVVTLKTSRKLDHRKTYRLTVADLRRGRVVDVYGIGLDGKMKGRPGSDFVPTIGKKPRA